MENFFYVQPVPIDFGAGKLHSLPAILEEQNLHRVLLISTPSMVRSGKAQELAAACSNRIVGIFSDIQPNPTVANTDACAKQLQDLNCDGAIALGGGSILDCAKVACFVATAAGTTSNYLWKELPIDQKGLPLIAIPTTSGTASEITNVSVLTDTDKNQKAPIASAFLYPDYALVDPELTLSCPSHVTAISGIDVLAHALEAFYGKKHQPYTDLAAEHSAKLVFQYLLKAYKEPENIEARAKMSEASVTAGMAFNLTQTAAAHACSYPLTQLFGVPHGEACAFTLSHFWRLNASGEEKERLDQFSQRLGFVDALALADAIDDLKREMGLRFTLEEIGVTTEEQLEMLIENSFAPNMQNNPVSITPDLLKLLYSSKDFASPQTI